MSSQKNITGLFNMAENNNTWQDPIISEYARVD